MSVVFDVMLTTTDNPFDPFKEFELWYNFDMSKGYNSCGYLARVTQTSDEFPEELQFRDIEAAIDEIVELNVLGIYKKVTKEDEELVKS